MEGPLSKIVPKAAPVTKKQPATTATIKAAKKLRKEAQTKKDTTSGPSDLDKSVAKALFDIQTSNASLAAELKPLQFYASRQVELPAGRKAIVISVPIPQLKSWRRVQLAVARELEKKFSDRSIIIIGHRRIIKKPKHGASLKQARPRSRTLTAVHDAWLEDMVYPTEIVGKRTRVKSDGKRVIKVFLDPNDQTALESKVDVFSSVYRQLTGKEVAFEFPVVASN